MAKRTREVVDQEPVPPSAKDAVAGDGAAPVPPKSVATAADAAEAAKLPATAKTHARVHSRSAVDLLANPEHEVALRSYKSTFQEVAGIDIDAAIDQAKAVQGGLDRAERLQHSADRVWASLEPGEAEVRQNVKSIADTIRIAKPTSPLRTSLDAFLKLRSDDLGQDKRDSTLRQKKKEKTPPKKE